MNKLIILAGLPGSGKTTFAESIVQSSRHWVRVNRDTLREMVGCGRPWDLMDEAIVSDYRDVCIISALMKGRSVIVDDTNLKTWTRTHIADLAEVLGIRWEIHWFDTPVEECIRRDALRGPRSIGRENILAMAKGMERED